MNLIETHELDIINMLASLVNSNVKISLFPENEFQESDVPAGKNEVRLFSGFVSNDYTYNQNIFTQRSAGTVDQEEYSSYEITILAKKLRGTNGIYEYIQKIKELLVGKSPSSSGPFYLNKVGFVTRENGYHQYGVVVSTKGLFIQTEAPFEDYPEGAELGPTLQNLEYDEAFAHSKTFVLAADQITPLTTEEDNKIEI